MPKINKPTVQEFNMETGETITREFTAEELEQWEARQAAQAVADAAKAKAEADKAALLARLGITAEETKTLLS